jgi:hypothetical protein
MATKKNDLSLDAKIETAVTEAIARFEAETKLPSIEAEERAWRQEEHAWRQEDLAENRLMHRVSIAASLLAGNGGNIAAAFATTDALIAAAKETK